MEKKCNPIYAVFFLPAKGYRNFASRASSPETKTSLQSSTLATEQYRTCPDTIRFGSDPGWMFFRLKVLLWLGDCKFFLVAAQNPGYSACAPESSTSFPQRAVSDLTKLLNSPTDMIFG